MQQIPMYVFTGFLESGKTKFIQETLEDERFNAGEKTLLLRQLLLREVLFLTLARDVASNGCLVHLEYGYDSKPV